MAAGGHGAGGRHTVSIREGDGRRPIRRVQLVFLRCLVGLVLVAPLAWRERQALLATRRRGLHLVRVGCNAVALTCSFTAVAALPLAVVTSIGFTRPLIVLALAALLLREAIGRRHWVAAGIGFAGVLVMARPEAAGLFVRAGGGGRGGRLWLGVR